jgi:16S rRNA (cytidine1402-2'-O)-methyltransferase
VILYEAPHRILETLSDLAELLPNRPVVLARELTKLHEEFLEGAAAELREALTGHPSLKGEFTILIGKGEPPEVDFIPLHEAFEKLIASGVPRMDAMKTLARQRGMSKQEIYKQLNVRE